MEDRLPVVLVMVSRDETVLGSAEACDWLKCSESGHREEDGVGDWNLHCSGGSKSETRRREKKKKPADMTSGDAKTVAVVGGGVGI